MKVKYKELIRSYRGKMDGLVYYYHPGLRRCIAREYVKPRPTENNRRLAAVSANLRALEPAREYLQDLKVYRALVQQHPDTEHHVRGHQWILFTRLMWAQCRAAGLDPETVTRAQIEALELPCRSVKTAVEAGLLPEVAGYGLLTREM